MPKGLGSRLRPRTEITSERMPQLGLRTRLSKTRNLLSPGNFATLQAPLPYALGDYVGDVYREEVCPGRTSHRETSLFFPLLNLGHTHCSYEWGACLGYLVSSCLFTGRPTSVFYRPCG